MKFFKMEFSKSRDENIRPKFLSGDREKIITATRKIDCFFDEKFRLLESNPMENTFPFTREEVKQMYVLFERFTRGVSSKFDPDNLAKSITLKEPQYRAAIKRELKPGDSIIFFIYGRDVVQSTIAHELAHVVYNSFCEPYGVNFTFKDYFIILDILVRWQFRYTKDSEKLLIDKYRPEKIEKEKFCYAVQDSVFPEARRQSKVI